MTKITLRKVKTMQGRDAEVISADIYFDNKKVASVFNDGNGGDNDYYFESGITEEYFIEQLKCFTIDHATGVFAQKIGSEYANYVDWAIIILLDYHEYDKLSKKAVLFKDNIKDENVYSSKYPDHVLKTNAQETYIKMLKETTMVRDNKDAVIWGKDGWELANV